MCCRPASSNCRWPAIVCLSRRCRSSFPWRGSTIDAANRGPNFLNRSKMLVTAPKIERISKSFGSFRAVRELGLDVFEEAVRKWPL